MEAFDAVYGKALRLARSLFEMADCPPRALRGLRSEAQRRRLKRWAIYRREDRAERKKQAARKAEGDRPAGVTSISRWLRRCWRPGVER